MLNAIYKAPFWAFYFFLSFFAAFYKLFKSVLEVHYKRFTASSILV